MSRFYSTQVSHTGRLLPPAGLHRISGSFGLPLRPGRSATLPSASPISNRWLYLSWGVYPIGYILTTIDGINLNWVHIACSMADIINKVGVGAIAFQAAERVLERRLAETGTALNKRLGTLVMFNKLAPILPESSLKP